MANIQAKRAPWYCVIAKKLNPFTATRKSYVALKEMFHMLKYQQQWNGIYGGIMHELQNAYQHLKDRADALEARIASHEAALQGTIAQLQETIASIESGETDAAQVAAELNDLATSLDNFDKDPSVDHAAEVQTIHPQQPTPPAAPIHSEPAPEPEPPVVVAPLALDPQQPTPPTEDPPHPVEEGTSEHLTAQETPVQPAQ